VLRSILHQLTEELLNLTLLTGEIPGTRKYYQIFNIFVNLYFFKISWWRRIRKIWFWLLHLSSKFSIEWRKIFEIRIIDSGVMVNKMSKCPFFKFSRFCPFFRNFAKKLKPKTLILTSAIKQWILYKMAIKFCKTVYSFGSYDQSKC